MKLLLSHRTTCYVLMVTVVALHFWSETKVNGSGVDEHLSNEQSDFETEKERSGVGMRQLKSPKAIEKGKKNSKSKSYSDKAKKVKKSNVSSEDLMENDNSFSSEDLMENDNSFSITSTNPNSFSIAGTKNPCGSGEVFEEGELHGAETGTDHYCSIQMGDAVRSDQYCDLNNNNRMWYRCSGGQFVNKGTRQCLEYRDNWSSDDIKMKNCDWGASKQQFHIQNRRDRKGRSEFRLKAKSGSDHCVSSRDCYPGKCYFGADQCRHREKDFFFFKHSFKIPCGDGTILAQGELHSSEIGYDHLCSIHEGDAVRSDRACDIHNERRIWYLCSEGQIVNKHTNECLTYDDPDYSWDVIKVRTCDFWDRRTQQFDIRDMRTRRVKDVPNDASIRTEFKIKAKSGNDHCLSSRDCITGFGCYIGADYCQNRLKDYFFLKDTDGSNRLTKTRFDTGYTYPSYYHEAHDAIVASEVMYGLGRIRYDLRKGTPTYLKGNKTALSKIFFQNMTEPDHPVSLQNIANTLGTVPSDMTIDNFLKIWDGNVRVSYYAERLDKLPPAGLKNTYSPYKTDMLSNVDFQANNAIFSTSGRSDNVAALYEFWLQFPPDGSTELCISSNDGSKLFLGEDDLIIDNDGVHPYETKCTTKTLSGPQKLKIEYFEKEGGATLIFEWKLPGEDRTVVPSSEFIEGDSGIGNKLKKTELVYFGDTKPPIASGKNPGSPWVFGIFDEKNEKRISIWIKGSTEDEDKNGGKEWLDWDGKNIHCDFVEWKVDGRCIAGLDRMCPWVHEGYKTVVDANFDDIKNKLTELFSKDEYVDYKVYIFGHSMGGATAQLLGFRLVSEYQRGLLDLPMPISIVTDASPQIANNEFQDTTAIFERAGLLRNFRLTNHDDWVPGTVGGKKDSSQVYCSLDILNRARKTGIEIELYRDISLEWTYYYPVETDYQRKLVSTKRHLFEFDHALQKPYDFLKIDCLGLGCGGYWHSADAHLYSLISLVDHSKLSAVDQLNDEYEKGLGR